MNSKDLEKYQEANCLIEIHLVQLPTPYTR